MILRAGSAFGSAGVPKQTPFVPISGRTQHTAAAECIQQRAAGVLGPYPNLPADRVERPDWVGG